MPESSDCAIPNFEKHLREIYVPFVTSTGDISGSLVANAHSVLVSNRILGVPVTRCARPVLRVVQLLPKPLDDQDDPAVAAGLAKDIWSMEKLLTVAAAA